MKDLINLLSQRELNHHKVDVKNLLINQNWILVNKIDDAKTVYYFHNDNRLTTTTNGIVSEAKWHYVNPDYIRISSKTSVSVIKLKFRDEDILTLDIDRHSNTLAVFINQSKSGVIFNSYEDITNYLHDKYVTKAKNIINNHEYYYIENSEEYGPVTAKQLIQRAQNNSINKQCLIRDIYDNDYSKRLRIQDLINVF